MTSEDEPVPAVQARRGRRAVRIVLMCLVVAAILFLAVNGWLSGR
jgi:TRAP-type C4-dicarboxylate transport system permease small subunit